MTSSTSSHPPERWLSLLGSVPVITLGLLLVTIAMLKAPWPSDPKSLTGATVSYSERLQGKPREPVNTEGKFEKSAAWYTRRVLDGLALGFVVIGYISLTLMIMLDEWRALIVLTLIGAVGTLYGGSVGLTIGPVLVIGGFALVLFGAGLSLISQYTIEAKYRATERESTYDTHFAAQP